MPRTPFANQLDLPEQEIRFDVAAFDEAVKSHGIWFKHWRAMRCPGGLIDPKDIRRPHADHAGCSNGYIYTAAGKIGCLFTGNGLSPSAEDPGLAMSAHAQITLPRYYEGTIEEVTIAPFDRLFLDQKNITVSFWQLAETNQTGIDKLNFPIVKVIDLMDAHLTRYYEGDYTIQDGRIVWGSNRPPYDAENNRGTVYSVRYTYHPYWYVIQLPHEIRVAHVEEDFLEGTRCVVRMPQFATIQREYVFENQDNDPEAVADSNKARQIKGPSETLVFGPR